MAVNLIVVQMENGFAPMVGKAVADVTNISKSHFMTTILKIQIEFSR